jgi:hypothetical protein
MAMLPLQPEVTRRTQQTVTTILALLFTVGGLGAPILAAWGAGSWKPLLFLPLSGGVGVGALWLVRRFGASLLEDAQVEVDSYRVRPDATVAVRVTLRAPRQLPGLRVVLICEQNVSRPTSRQRRQTRRCFEIELADRRPLRVDARVPLVLDLEAVIPSLAESTRDDLHWYIVVQTITRDGLTSDQRFELEVEAAPPPVEPAADAGPFR